VIIAATGRPSSSGTIQVGGPRNGISTVCGWTPADAPGTVDGTGEVAVVGAQRRKDFGQLGKSHGQVSTGRIGRARPAFISPCGERRLDDRCHGLRAIAQQDIVEVVARCWRQRYRDLSSLTPQTTRC
jgi:hypothetical protein